jgi:hypothetical protein
MVAGATGETQMTRNTQVIGMNIISGLINYD